MSSTMIGQVLTWKMKHAVSGQLLEVGTSGTVQSTLQKHNYQADPFYGENEKEYQWVEGHAWEFYSEFMLDSVQMTKDHVELHFPSLDTYVTIYLNGKELARTENAFHPHHLGIKKLARIGLNQLKLVFTPPVMFHASAYRKGYKYPAPNDAGELMVAPLCRKPQYQFGWDWALRINTMGLWKAASLKCYNENRIRLAKVETKSLKTNKATMELFVRLEHLPEKDYKVSMSHLGKEGIRIGKKENRLEFEISDPNLWWPRGYGEQHLYRDTVIIHDDSGNVIDSWPLIFGVRTTELVQEDDQWGTSFYFKINGHAVFCKGANFIPQDVFPEHVTEEQTRHQVEMMKESNFNMIRVWGGGYYQSEAFYQACDEMGILVWQDLMFACAMYPGDEHFLGLVRKELSEELPRMAGHPSVVYINGNNEVAVAWKHWGFQIRYAIGRRKQKKIEAAYEAIFKKLAPEQVEQYTYLPYVHTSPLSNWGKAENFNHGTMHYWGVWHGRDPIEDFGLKTGRFNAEYGFQSFPEYATLESFSEEKDWRLKSDVMKHHQKSYVGNGMIKKHSDILYGQTDDFRRFVYYSQLTQAKAVGIAVAGHRSDAPRCMGTLYWQFNDCWPAPTWSGIDYFGNWKALQYEMKKDYADVAVIERVRKLGEGQYLLVYDGKASFVSEISYVAHDLNGKELFKGEESIQIDGPWLQEVAMKSKDDAFREQNFVLEINWMNELGEIQCRKFFHERENFERASESQVEILLEDVQNDKANLVLKTSAFLADCWIYSQQGGIRFSENFESYLPGEYKIEIHFQEKPDLKDFQAIWR